MSKTIDQRVVEMQFDNRNFERNVSTTMSSVEKLKQSLNFTGAAKGLENVSSAAKKVDMNGLGSAVETVRARFSALEVMGVTALANITNSAINAGKRMISSFTIDPIISGFQEYETQMNAIQTIMSNTRSKGSTLEEVKDALAELNTYADQTIYNFTEMTRNIGTFTAAGVGLDESVNAIKGIANLAAVSGSNSLQASTAMYQLSQALAAGRVSLMDWNSVVNAGMGGELFQNALIRTAQVMGTGVDQAIEKYGTFRESLTKGQWLTAEVLTETLAQLSGAYTKADLIAQGYTESQAKEIVALADDAVAAATEVKTFTQLMDTMHEAVGSGWAQTWQLIIGDFEEAKEFWGGISEFFTGSNGVITKMSNARNTILEGALSGNPFSKLIDRINSVTGVTEKMTKAAVDFDAVVSKVIGGEFGNGAARVEALTKAGYDYAYVQNLVNEKLGSSVRHATDYKEAQDGVSKSTKTTIDDLVKLSDAQLVMMGFTNDEVEALRELEAQSKKTGIPLNKLIENVDLLNGRTLLINSFKNAAKGLVQIFTAVSDGWRKAFWGDASEDEILDQKTERLYNMIAALHKFSQNLVLSDDTVKNLTRTFEGLFAIVDIITTVLGGGFKLAFEFLSKVLGAFNMDILDFTAMLGDAAVELRNFLLDNELIDQGLEAIASGIVAAAKAIKSWIDAFVQLPMVQAAIDNFSTSLQRLKDGFQNGLISLPQFLSGLGQNAIAGLQNGFSDGISGVISMLAEFGRRILDTIKDVLGIHSPSTEMYEVGKFSIEGLVNGIQDGLSSVIGVFRSLIDAGLQVLKDAPWGPIIAVSLIGGMTYAISRIATAVTTLAAPLEGLGDIFDSVAKSIDKLTNSFSKLISAKAFSLRLDAISGFIKSFAISIGILAASLYVLGKIDFNELVQGAVALGVLMAAMTAIALLVSNFGGKGSTISFAGFAAALILLSTSMLAMSGALKVLNSLDPERMGSTLTAFMVIIVGMVGIIGTYATLSNGENLKGISKVGTMMLSFSASLILMAAVIKIMGGMSAEKIVKGGAAILAFAGITTVLSAIGRGANEKSITQVGSLMLKMAVALGLMVGVVKLISTLSAEEMLQGAVAITAFTGIIALMVTIARIAPEKEFAKIGSTLLAMSSSLLIMTVVTKLLSSMNAEDILKGSAAMVAFTGIIALMIQITKMAGDKLPNVIGTVTAISVSIGILAAIAVVLSLIDLAGLAKGITAVGALSAMVSVMVYMTKYAKNIQGTMTGLSIAIGVMAASVAVLSFIDPAKLAGATAAVSILIGMFALLMKASGAVNASMKTVITMGVVIGLLSSALVVLTMLPIEDSLSTVASLSLLMVSLSAAMKVLGTIQKVSPASILALTALGAIAVGLGALLGLLENLDLAPSLSTVTSISAFLLAMSGVTAILSLLGMGGAGSIVAAASGAASLVTVIGIIGAVMVAIGGLNSLIPQLSTFVNDAIPILADVGTGIGAFVGGIVGGALAGLTNGLPQVSTNLSDFMENLQPFLDGASTIDSDDIDAISSLAEMILALTAANVIEGLTSFIPGVSSLGDFGQKLVPFGTAIADFAEEIEDIDPDAVNAATNAGQALANLATTIPKQGGVLQNFFGSQDLEVFGEQLEDFAGSLVDFSDELAEGNFSSETVTAAANAGQSLADLANNIPKQGGVLKDFLGSQDLGIFGSQLLNLAQGLVDFSNKLSEGNFSAENTTAAANAGQALADLANNIPKQNGVLQDFLGTQNLGYFGTQLVALGTGLANFSDKLSEGNFSGEMVTAAANAGQSLADLAKNLPKQNGVLQNFFGDQDLAEFGNQLTHFGWAFRTYADYIQDIKPSVVTASANAASSLVTLADSLPDNKLFVNETTLDEFGSQLSEFGSYFAHYYESIKTVNTAKVSSVVDEIWRILSLGKGIAGFDSTAMSNFGYALGDMGDLGVKEFISAFDGSADKVQTAVDSMLSTFSTAVETNKTKLNTTFATMISDVISTLDSQSENFKMAAKTFADSFVTGIKDKEPTFKSTINLVMANLISSIRGRYDDFQSAGRYLVDGMISGMNDRRSNANSAARSLANSVVTSMKDELDIHSPSGVIRDEVGHWIVEGLADGITEDMSAEEAASKKAQNITNAFQSELSLLDLAEQTAELEAELAGTNVDYLAQQERQVRRVELAYGEYQVMLENFGETATETQESYNKYLQEEIDLRTMATEQADEAAQKLRENYEAQIDLFDGMREEQKISLLDLLAVYKNLQRQYEVGSQERIEIDEKILSLQEEIADATDEYYNSVTEIQEEANAERLQLDQDYEDQRTQIKEEANEKRLELDQEYADKTKEINDQLEADIESLEKAYEDAVNSRADTLYGSYGLFDEVAKDEEAVTGDQLMENLQGQLDAFEDWTKNLNSLIDRGLDEALIEELREMGPSSAAEIAALNAMTDEQLNQYVELWRQKHELAKNQALYELQGMREETDSQIEQLRKDAEIELEEYRATWRDQVEALDEETNDKLRDLRRNWLDQIDELDAGTQEKLKELKDDWMKSIVGLQTDTQGQFAKMTTHLINTVGDRSQWSAVGVNAIEGILSGIADATPDLINGVEDAMYDALRAANRALEIRSPSRKFGEVGRYSILGMANGLRDYAYLASDEAEIAGISMLNTLRNTIAGISDAINDNIDTQPTIRPVLDLTDLADGTKQLNTLFSRNQAVSISAGLQRRSTVTDDSDDISSNKAGNVYQFTQNNYSPKALSRVEIYRQTKNQFSAMQRTVET